MNIIKRAAAAAMAVILAAGTAACSTDKSWAAKNSSLTVPIGSYIYNLYRAYATASDKAQDKTKPILDQKIEGKDATSWIRGKALTYTKSMFVVDNKMKDMNLKLTDTENTNVKSATDTMWSQYQTALEKFGIAKSSFNLASSEYSAKRDKVFNAIYGKGGSKAVSDADLKSFFQDRYTDFSYIVRPLYSTDTNGNFKAALSDADKKKATQEFDGYADKIKAGSMTLDQANDAFKKSSGGTSSTVNNETIDFSTDTTYPDAMKTAIKAMKAGECKTLELKDLYLYVLVVKNDIAKKTDEKLKTDDGRKSILSDYKGTEFDAEISKEADALKDVTVNDAAINSYNPSMFVTAASSAASSK